MATNERAERLAARSHNRATPDRRAPAGSAVLLVEDSPLIARLVAGSIESALPYEVVVAGNYDEAKRVLEEDAASLHAAVVCLSLPGAPNGEIVELATGVGTPTIVLTGAYDEETRERVLAQPVVDYFIKEERSLRALNFILERLSVNRGVEILLVDDSPTQRSYIRQLLAAHHFRVHEASDGVEALRVIHDHPGVSLVITDYQMPRMDGIELVANLRSRRSHQDLAIIGLSSTGIGALSARYLKHGADDFLGKPFEKEEFYCRIYRSLVNLQQISEIKRSAYRDPLTGLSNRLGFFSTAPGRFADAVGAKRHLALGMIDIDNFKHINDTYGHAAGDAALRHLARVLRGTLPNSVLTGRIGGEEFCCLAIDAAPHEADDLFEELRAAVEGSSIQYDGVTIRFTVSIGVALFDHTHLDDSINRADHLLYDAKRAGRNRVVLEPQAAPPRYPVPAVIPESATASFPLGLGPNV